MPINAPRSRTIVLTDAGTSPFSAALVDYDGTIGGGTPIPAPVFTTPSSIAADGTPQVGEPLTGIDGVASDTTSYTRRWLLGSTILTSSAAYTPSAFGTYRYETIATGPGGETTSGSNITVAAASPILNALTISPSTATVGTSATITISGATAGSVITGTVPAGMTLNSAARTITGTPTTAGSPSIVLTETLAGATGSPRQSTVGVTIAAAPVTPVLGALTVSPSAATVGTAYSGTINGLTSGSSIALSGVGAAGLSIAGAVITGTPTTAGAVNIIETLAGATGSPRTSSGVITVAAAAVVLNPLTLSPSTATTGTAYTGTVSGKTSGSTMALSGTGAAGLTVSGSTVSGTPTAAGSVDIIETLAGATGSPRTSSGLLTVSAAASSERVAAYGTSIPVLSANKKSSGNLQRCTRKTVVIGADVPYITGTFDNYVTQPGGDTPVGASLTILQHAVINPDGSRSKIVTFGNGASTTKVLGTDTTTGIRIFHDKVYPADVFGAGVTMFRRGDRITLQTDALVSNDQASAEMVYNCHVAPLGDSAIEFPPTGAPVAPGVGSIPAQPSQAAANDGYTVSCIYGPHTSIAHLNLGDSIAADTGDSPLNAIRGGYSRAATNSYGLNPVPMVNLARHGTVMNDVFNTDLTPKSTGMMRMAYLAAGTFQQASENWAANDLGTSPSQSTYDITSANKLRLWQILRARGCEWITSVAPTPRTTSGSVNTPVNAGWARGGIADQLNQFLEDRLTAGTINAVVRSLALRMSTDRTNDNYFLYKTMDYALDGTHFSPVGYLALTPEHRSAVLRGNVANDEPAYTVGQVILDTFTTGVGGSVADRPTDSGSTWVRQGTADLWVTSEGRAYAKQAGYLYLKDARQGRHQYVERDTVIVAAATGTQNLILRRQAISDTTAGYNAAFNPGTFSVTISRISAASVSTSLAAVTISDPGGLYSNVGSQYTMRFEANGPYLYVYMGPKGGPLTLAVQTVDASYLTGDVGTRDNSGSSATTGRQMDEIRAGNLTLQAL